MLVNWYKEDPKNRRIATFNYQEKDRLVREFGVNPHHVWVPQITPMDDGSIVRDRPLQFAIDNVDLLLGRLAASHKAVIATYTRGSRNLPKKSIREILEEPTAEKS